MLLFFSFKPQFMITVPEVVRDIIKKTPFLEEALSADLLNLSSLARRIKSEVEERTFKEVTEGSIVMALKRLQPQLTPPRELVDVMQKTPEIIVRSNLYEITVVNSNSLINKQKKLLEYASIKHSYFATITHGVFETTIIASEEAKETIQEMYKNEHIISEVGNLSSITIKYPLEIIDTPGVYYSVLKVLAWENIPFTEVVSTYSEVTIVLKDSYVDRAFILIKGLFAKKM